jgi:iron complex transport system substrate-binding protein
MHPPERIVCLTEETTETLYLLGEQQRIVGISGYTVRPPRARKEKPRVSAFISADIPKILALDPDLVLTFSDLQADIVAALIRRSVSPCLQSAHGCRHPRYDPNAWCARRRGRTR